MQADLDNAGDGYTEKLMRLQMEHGRKLLTVEHRLKRSRDVVEEKDAQIARLTAATSVDTSIAMAMNAKTEVNLPLASQYDLIVSFSYPFFFFRFLNL